MIEITEKVSRLLTDNVGFNENKRLAVLMLAEFIKLQQYSDLDEEYIEDALLQIKNESNINNWFKLIKGE